MRKRKTVQGVRRAKRAAKDNARTFGDLLTFSDVTWVDGGSLYFDQTAATTITFDTSGFTVGDTITIAGATQQKIKSKKKVHVARRRMKTIEPSYTITNMSSTNITIAANGLASAQKISDCQWIVNGTVV